MIINTINWHDFRHQGDFGHSKKKTFNLLHSKGAFEVFFFFFFFFFFWGGGGGGQGLHFTRSLQYACRAMQLRFFHVETLLMPLS